ncbi:type I restriction endonuclease [Bacteroides ovatus]|nr:type I restriction endonuclease [Bacteroides ovatus]
MSDYIDQKEREYQNEIVKLFCDELKYDYLGKLQYAKSKTTLDNGEKNSPIIDSEVRRFLSSPSNHYTDFQIEEALRILKEETRLPDKKRGILSDTSNSVYERLITHIAIQPDAEHKHENVTLFDFDNPFTNHFAIAEEVSYIDPLTGKHSRPDIVVLCQWYSPLCD